MTGLLTMAIASGAIAGMNANNQADNQPPVALVEQSIRKEERPYFVRERNVWHAMTEREYGLYQQEQEERMSVYTKNMKEKYRTFNLFMIITISVMAIPVIVYLWERFKLRNEKSI